MSFFPGTFPPTILFHPITFGIRRVHEMDTGPGELTFSPGSAAPSKTVLVPLTPSSKLGRERLATLKLLLILTYLMHMEGQGLYRSR